MKIRLLRDWHLGAPTSLGMRLDTSAEAFGTLRDSTEYRDDLPELRRRIAADGYLLLRGLLDRDAANAACAQIVASLAARGLLSPSFPIAERIAAPGVRVSKFGFEGEDRRFTEVRTLVRSEWAMNFFDDFLATQSRAFDYIWMRLMAPGQASAPHCDIVYMGRGTHEFLTAWIPLTEMTPDDGPLMVLEGSHLIERLRIGYATMDVDKDGNWRRLKYRHGRLFRGGDYSRNPRRTRAEFGLRWLTSEFAPGDLVIFTPYTLHGSLDNHSTRFRISLDARYQRACEPIDERWIGEHPIGHSQAE